jgi:hypothetical protein
MAMLMEDGRKEGNLIHIPILVLAAAALYHRLTI